MSAMMGRKTKKHPQKIGSSWRGKSKTYIHGPRLVSPTRCAKGKDGKPLIRLGKPSATGRRAVLCKLKATGVWVRQSTITPINPKLVKKSKGGKGL